MVSCYLGEAEQEHYVGVHVSSCNVNPNSVLTTTQDWNEPSQETDKQTSLAEPMS